MYPKMLDFDPVVMASISMTVARQCISPMIVSKGNFYNYSKRFVVFMPPISKEMTKLRLLRDSKAEKIQLLYEIMEL